MNLISFLTFHDTDTNLGGGTGGSIRDAGGAFGKMEAAHEEQYFRKLQQEQLKTLKKHHDDEIDAHESEINRHKEAIKRLHKKKKEIDERDD
ncbi:putative ATPase inhibitor, mitochondrial [Apostichopus japonicus]|uniref:ATP synthase F1 subunit epsilon n=1 Tax=Stichopus japonicus TaxID=307972 RepID=A0A2G8L720_STIJA|nr:putative ATPase inhibitor, mitochondrial [Apostichopus japonicus]